MSPGWRGGCFWEAGAGGPASPLAVIGFSFPSPCTKGPLRAVGKLLRASASSCRSLQLLKSHSSPAQARRSGAGICRAKAKETAGTGSDGRPPGAGPPPARRQPWGPPGPSPGLQPRLFRCRPASILGVMLPWPPRICLPGELPAATLLPGHSCPFLREETKVPFCRVGRAAAVATSDRAAGQSPTPLPSRPLSLAAPGAPGSAASPAHGPGAVPASLWLRAVKPRGMLLPKKQDGAGERDQHCFSQTCTRSCIVVGREQG